MRHLKQLGNRFSILIPRDEKGSLGRECPECERYFKITPGTGLTGENLPRHCPYCGHSAQQDQFFTKAQIEFAKSVAINKVTGAFIKDLKRLEFNHRPRGPFGIGISIKVEGRPNSGLSPETLIEVGSDHRLADEESLSVMLWACNLLGAGEKLPWQDDEPQSPADYFSNGKATSQEDASYVCDACGEEIIILLDLTEGSSQTYVEDCPVCCRANTIHVQIDEDGNAQVWTEPEQDND